MNEVWKINSYPKKGKGDTSTIFLSLRYRRSRILLRTCHEEFFLIRTECGARSCLCAMEYFYTEIVGCQKNDEEPGTAMHVCLVL